MKDPNFQEIATGKTPSGRPVRVLLRSVITGYTTYTLASGNCIWCNGTLGEMLDRFGVVTSVGMICSNGEVL